MAAVAATSVLILATGVAEARNYAYTCLLDPPIGAADRLNVNVNVVGSPAERVEMGDTFNANDFQGILSVELPIPITVTNLVVAFPIPAGADYVPGSVVAGGGGSGTVSGGNMVWSLAGPIDFPAGPLNITLGPIGAQFVATGDPGTVLSWRAATGSFHVATALGSTTATCSADDPSIPFAQTGIGVDPPPLPPDPGPAVRPQPAPQVAGAVAEGPLPPPAPGAARPVSGRARFTG